MINEKKGYKSRNKKTERNQLIKSEFVTAFFKLFFF